jgi:hypothetical protein
MARFIEIRLDLEETAHFHYLKKNEKRNINFRNIILHIKSI